MPQKQYEPEPVPPRPSRGLIQLAGSDLSSQCINFIDKKQCGKRKRPGSEFCSPECTRMYRRAHPGTKLT